MNNTDNPKVETLRTLKKTVKEMLNLHVPSGTFRDGPSVPILSSISSAPEPITGSSFWGKSGEQLVILKVSRIETESADTKCWFQATVRNTDGLVLEIVGYYESVLNNIRDGYYFKCA